MMNGEILESIEPQKKPLKLKSPSNIKSKTLFSPLKCESCFQLNKVCTCLHRKMKSFRYKKQSSENNKLSVLKEFSTLIDSVNKEKCEKIINDVCVNENYLDHSQINDTVADLSDSTISDLSYAEILSQSPPRRLEGLKPFNSELHSNSNDSNCNILKDIPLPSEKLISQNESKSLTTSNCSDKTFNLKNEPVTLDENINPDYNLKNKDANLHLQKSKSTVLKRSRRLEGLKPFNSELYPNCYDSNYKIPLEVIPLPSEMSKSQNDNSKDFNTKELSVTQSINASDSADKTFDSTNEPVISSDENINPDNVKNKGAYFHLQRYKSTVIKRPIYTRTRFYKNKNSTGFLESKYSLPESLRLRAPSISGSQSKK